MKLEVYNIKGKEIGRKIDLDKAIFQIDPNHHAIYLDVKQHLANKRQGTNSTKQRSFIKGSTKKNQKFQLVFLHLQANMTKNITNQQVLRKIIRLL